MHNFWDIAMIFAGTVIGAGFASGQEITEYFLSYGKMGVYGIFLSVFGFTFVAAVVLCKISATKAKNVEEYLGDNCPRLIRRLYSVLSALFMFVTFCAMLSATNEMFNEYLGLPGILGVLLIYAICLLSLKKGIAGVNKILTPIIIIVTVAVFIETYFTRSRSVFNIEKIFYNSTTSSLVYLSYNTLSIIAVFTSVSHLIKNRTVAVMAAITGGMMLLLASLCIWYVLYTSEGVAGAIPMLSDLDNVGKALYLPVLLFAMVTTAASCCYGLIKEAGRVKIMCFTALSYLVSIVGFKTLVANIYSIFGYIGFIIMIYTIIDGKKYLKR